MESDSQLFICWAKSFILRYHKALELSWGQLVNHIETPSSRATDALLSSLVDLCLAKGAICLVLLED